MILVAVADGKFRELIREEAHQLIDAVPDDRLADAVELLRKWVETR